LTEGRITGNTGF